MPRLIRKVVKWGHNTALLLPKTVLHELKVQAGDHVVLHISDGALHVRELADDIWRMKIAQQRAAERENGPVQP